MSLAVSLLLSSKSTKFVFNTSPLSSRDFSYLWDEYKRYANKALSAVRPSFGNNFDSLSRQEKGRNHLSQSDAGEDTVAQRGQNQNLEIS